VAFGGLRARDPRLLEGGTGPAGPAGSTDVIYSEWYSPETWRTHDDFGIHCRAYDIPE